MNEEEIKEILKDPKKILNLFRLFHQMIHIYEAEELKKQMQSKSPSQETMGLSDSVDIKVTHPNSESSKIQEVKK